MTSVYPDSGRGDSHPAPDPRPPSLVERILYPEWGPIVAGGIAAAALALVLHAFAVGIGLSVGSTAPTWRDASFALVLLSALYVVLAALASYGLGGYLVGLMCTRPSSREDADLRDGLHGLLVWALATLLSAVIAFATAQSLTRLAAPSGGQTGPSTSIGGCGRFGQFRAQKCERILSRCSAGSYTVALAPRRARHRHRGVIVRPQKWKSR
jgi:hypothetical protein